MDLLCIDFMKVDLSKDGKENVLVITNAFLKFSVAVVMPNQQAKTVAKPLVDKWFYTYGIPSRVHSDQGKSFNNKIIEQLCKIYGVKKFHHHTIESLWKFTMWVVKLHIAKFTEDTA